MKKLLLIGNKPLNDDYSDIMNSFDKIVRVNRMTNYDYCKGKTDLWLSDISKYNNNLYDEMQTEFYTDIKEIIVFKYNLQFTSNYLHEKNCCGNITGLDFDDIPIQKYFKRYKKHVYGYSITNIMWMLIYCLEKYGDEYEIHTLGMSERTFLKEHIHKNHYHIYPEEEIVYQQLIYSNKIIPEDDNKYCEIEEIKPKYTGKIPLFSSFWHSESDILPDMVVASINSFVKNGCPYHLYTYKEYKNVPEGCVLKDANEIVNESEFFIGSRNDVCSFSDMFRIKLVNQVDTAWTDTDNFFFSDDFETEEVMIEQDGRIQNSFFYLGKSVKGRLFKMLLQDFYDNPTKIQYYDNAEMKCNKNKIIKYSNKIDQLSNADWGIGGSCLFTNINEYLGLNDIVYNYYVYFNAFHYSNQHILWCEKELPYMHFLNKDVKILVMSMNLLDREKEISESYDKESYMSKLIYKYTHE